MPKQHKVDLELLKKLFLKYEEKEAAIENQKLLLESALKDKSNVVKEIFLATNKVQRLRYKGTDLWIVSKKSPKTNSEAFFFKGMAKTKNIIEIDDCFSPVKSKTTKNKVPISSTPKSGIKNNRSEDILNYLSNISSSKGRSFTQIVTFTRQSSSKKEVERTRSCLKKLMASKKVYSEMVGGMAKYFIHRAL